MASDISDNQFSKEPPIVDLANVALRSRSGGSIFRDLNLVLKPGCSVIITGPAGSGKSSLADLILGRRKPESGSVEVFSHQISPRKRRRLQKIRSGIGGVGGVFELLPLLTVAANIELPLIIAGERKKTRQDSLRRSLSEFSLLNQADLFPRQLTRVENMMAQLARASVASQPLMIIDEPMAGLDAKTYERVLDYLFNVAVSGRSMIILSSEPPSRTLPQTDVRALIDGALV